ncbi:MAG: DUF2125 domain-containing protein [Stellaceae bacterium]
MRGKVSGDRRRGHKRGARIAGLRFRIDGAGRPAYNAGMRRLVLSLLLVSAALCAGYTGYWVFLAHRLQAEIGPWAEAERARGTAVGWDSLAVEGFPLVIGLRFTQATASGEKPLPFTAAAPLLLAETRLWDGRHWRVSVPDGARAALPGAAGEFGAASVDGTVGLDRAGGAAIDLAARALAGSGIAAGTGIATAELQLTLPDRAPAGHLDTAFAASLRLAHVSLPVTLPSFGKDIETLTLAVTLKGALPPGKLRDAVAAWRQDGGTIELTDGSLRWGALEASANGTLALDDQLQPVGALTATIENHNAIIDAAVAGGTLRAGDANLVKLLLGLMAKPGADGRKQLTLPVSLQNDRLYLGPAQIAALPRITWE